MVRDHRTANDPHLSREPKSRSGSLHLLSFLEEEPRLRHIHFNGWSEQQVRPILQEWAQHDEFRITDMLAMPEPFNVWTDEYLRQTGRSFAVRVNDQWQPPAAMTAEAIKTEREAELEAWAEMRRECVMLELPMSQNERKFKELRGVEILSTEAAVQALMHFGEHAAEGYERGRLIEISKEEYAAEVSKNASLDPKALLMEVATDEAAKQAAAILAEARAQAEKIVAEAKAAAAMDHAPTAPVQPEPMPAPEAPAPEAPTEDKPKAKPRSKSKKG